MISPTDPKSRAYRDAGITSGQWPVHGQGENHVVPGMCRSYEQALFRHVFGIQSIKSCFDPRSFIWPDLSLRLRSKTIRVSFPPHLYTSCKKNSIHVEHESRFVSFANKIKSFNDNCNKMSIVVRIRIDENGSFPAGPFSHSIHKIAKCIMM